MSLGRRPGLTRRSALATLGGAALAGPFYRLLSPLARAADGDARRLIIFYYPDGVPGPSQNGDPSAWHPTGGGTSFQLNTCTAPLERHKDRCVFFRGLSMGGTDAGSHPGGAKKLLTAVDGGGGESIDQLLSRTAGAGSWWRHLYLGAQANVNNASGDKHIVYPAPGQSMAPMDDPREAFRLLFGQAPAPGPSTPDAPAGPTSRQTVVDSVLGDLQTLQARLGGVEASKLALHLEAVREIEARLAGAPPGTTSQVASCQSPAVDTSRFGDGTLYDPAAFGAILEAQLDLGVLAAACGLTKVVTIQASLHTSELVMSRIPGTDFHDPGYDMRSHQASHYGASHNLGSREYAAYVAQRVWWTEQFARLLDRLEAMPDGDSNMLETSVVAMVTEVCDGNTHLHDDMPFVIAGGGNGRLRTGQLIDTGYRRHADLWMSVAHAMGERISWFGDASSGVIGEMLR